MKNKTILRIIAALIILVGFPRAQEKEQKIELPQLTLEEKWETAESNLYYFICCGIAYAKSKGDSPEEFGTFTGEVAAPSWEKGKAKGPAYLVRGISWNKQQFNGFKLEILAESESSIRGRMNIPWEDVIKERSKRYGVSVDEFNRFFEKKWEAIADYLGLEYKQKVEEDWIVFTVTEKN